MRTESFLRPCAAESRYGQRRIGGTAAGNSRTRSVRMEHREDRNLFSVTVDPLRLSLASRPTRPTPSAVRGSPRFSL